jgi:Tfp pilus assembly protein PilO
MNHEVKKNVLIRIVLVACVLCFSWYFFVNPKAQEVHSQRDTETQYSQMIQAYQSEVGSLNSGESKVVEEQLQHHLTRLQGMMNTGDPGTKLHTLINESAGESSVSVSRIETVNSRELVQKNELVDGNIKGITHSVRIEVEGDFSSVVAFMDRVAQNRMQVEFSSFRMIPMGYQSVRLNAELHAVMLTAIPTELASGESDDMNLGGYNQ